MPPVEAAVLLHLDALAVVHLRLHRDVVPPLALLAGQRDLDALVACHVVSLVPCVGRGTRQRDRSLWGTDRIGYLMILTTRPAPTVRPPSRIANRNPSSIAIGLPNDTVI